MLKKSASGVLASLKPSTYSAVRLTEMQGALAEHEQLDVVASLPFGQVMSVEVVGYANPALATIGG